MRSRSGPRTRALSVGSPAFVGHRRFSIGCGVCVTLAIACYRTNVFPNTAKDIVFVFVRYWCYTRNGTASLGQAIRTWRGSHCLGWCFDVGRHGDDRCVGRLGIGLSFSCRRLKTTCDFALWNPSWCCDGAGSCRYDLLFLLQLLLALS
jgi:hypothetical protein